MNKKEKKVVKAKTSLDIKKMGIDIDKNEYMEIVQSNSNHPEYFRNAANETSFS
jgi:hypothetical protein